MASKSNKNRIITFSALAIVAVTGLGSSYYFLKNSVSADTLPPSLTQNNSSIALPPVPAAPVNETSGSTSSSGASTNSSFVISPTAPTSSSNTGSSVNSFGIDTATTDQTSSTTDSAIGSLTSATAVPLGSTDESLIGQPAVIKTPVATTAATDTTSSAGNKLYGIIAAVVAGVALIALITLAVRGNKPQETNGTDIPQI